MRRKFTYKETRAVWMGAMLCTATVALANSFRVNGLDRWLNLAIVPIALFLAWSDYNEVTSIGGDEEEE